MTLSLHVFNLYIYIIVPSLKKKNSKKKKDDEKI